MKVRDFIEEYQNLGWIAIWGSICGLIGYAIITQELRQTGLIP